MKRLLPLLSVAIPFLSFAAGSNPDEGFFTRIAEGGLAEVAAGKLAETKGTTPSVKQFGAMMVKDHGAANEKLKSIASAKGIKLPTEPGLTQKTKGEMLEHKEGADFDREYLDGQINDHIATEELLQKEISSGKDPDAQAFAREVLPKVQAHLKAVQDIKASR
jgi:putative membrane protein